MALYIIYLLFQFSAMLNTYDFKISHPDKFKQLRVKDLLIVYYKCPQEEKLIQLYTHYNEIAFTLSGVKTFYQGLKSYLLTDDTALFIRKTAYFQELDQYKGWEAMAFYFTDEFLRQVFIEYRDELPLRNLPSPPTEMLINIKVNETTKTFIYSMIPIFNQKIPPSDKLLELKFKELLYNVFSNPENVEILSYVNSIVDQYKTPISQLMEANFMFNLSIPDFARLTGRSVSTFKREFQELYQTSPGKWLSNKKLEHAKSLLTKSRKNVNEIAFECGYENNTHFSRTFKNKYGMPPTEYRNNHR